MESGQMLSIAQIQQVARQALDDAGVNQSEAARTLDVSRSTVSKALRQEDSRPYLRTLSRIIERYTNFRVVDTPHYRIEQK